MGFGTVADDVAEADDVLHAPAVDLLEHRGERFQVPVNIADDCKHRSAQSPRGARPLSATPIAPAELGSPSRMA
jgi:hypothetical protein